MEFPVAFKQINGFVFYLVKTPTEMELLEIIGYGYAMYTKFADIYPDKLLILDMLNGNLDHLTEISVEEYEKKKVYCKANLQLIK